MVVIDKENVEDCNGEIAMVLRSTGWRESSTYKLSRATESTTILPLNNETDCEAGKLSSIYIEYDSILLAFTVRAMPTRFLILAPI